MGHGLQELRLHRRSVPLEITGENLQEYFRYGRGRDGLDSAPHGRMPARPSDSPPRYVLVVKRPSNMIAVASRACFDLHQTTNITSTTESPRQGFTISSALLQPDTVALPGAGSGRPTNQQQALTHLAEDEAVLRIGFLGGLQLFGHLAAHVRFKLLPSGIEETDDDIAEKR